MSLACMELQLEQWSHTKGKNSECRLPFPVFISYYTSNHDVKAVYFFLVFIASPRSSSISPGDDECHSEFPGKHFQGDLLLLALGSCQKDLFENDWLDVMVRVYWLKARFLTLQVNVYLKFTFD